MCIKVVWSDVFMFILNASVPVKQFTFDVLKVGIVFESCFATSRFQLSSHKVVLIMAHSGKKIKFALFDTISAGSIYRLFLGPHLWRDQSQITGPVLYDLGIRDDHCYPAPAFQPRFVSVGTGLILKFTQNKGTCRCHFRDLPVQH